MSDMQIIGRVKVPHAGGPIEITATAPPVPPVARNDTGAVPDKALEVLTLAQRTAAAHVADAAGYVRKAMADADARAAKIEQDARAQAEQIRIEAETVLFEARAAAALSSQEAQAKAAE